MNLRSGTARIVGVVTGVVVVAIVGAAAIGTVETVGAAVARAARRHH